MFYIRTADRLERTAAWFNKLEGGIDYLRGVIIDDALGICDELEAEMDRHVETYECEWKATIESPERMRRFRTFVNSDDVDPNVVFVPERGQHRPAFLHEKPDPELLAKGVSNGHGPHSQRMKPSVQVDARRSTGSTCARSTTSSRTGASAPWSTAIRWRSSGSDDDGDEMFAISNYDPFSKAFVLSRGIVGSRGDRLKVASPIYKQSFDLRTGACLDDPEVSVRTFAGPGRRRDGPGGVPRDAWSTEPVSCFTSARPPWPRARASTSVVPSCCRSTPGSSTGSRST